MLSKPEKSFRFSLRALLFSLLSMLITGCVATAYQPTGSSGGYSHTQLDENIYHVYFKGNEYTSSERASDFALLRCAEITLESGMNYFRIIDEERYTIDDVQQYGKTIGIAHMPRSKYSIEIYMEKPNTGSKVFNATFLRDSIKTKYGIDDKTLHK